MASERFKFLIGEMPPPEEQREYTKKEKAQNFWHYYKYYFLGGAVVLIVLIATIVSMVTKVKPDYMFGIISADVLPESLTSALAKALEPYANDRNGDGRVAVTVNQYNISYNANEAQSEDPNVRMANVTRLVGDLQTCETMIFFVDDIIGLQNSDGFLAYNDGTFPEEAAQTDFSKMGVRWAESPVLTELPIGKIEIYGIEDESQYPDGQIFMQDFTMAVRAYDPSEKPQSKNSLYFNDCLKLFNSLIG